MLRCIEDGCGYKLGFKCASLPQVVKHRVDDHPLSLCFGEETSGRCWCDICEKEINLETWFYTCKDNRACLHIECVLGDFSRLMPGSTISFAYKPYQAVLNNSMSRPFCMCCKSHCIPSFIFKVGESTYGYICSLKCCMIQML